MIQNFTAKFCSTVDTSVSSPFQWYVKIIVKPGAILDTTNSKAAQGRA